MDLIAPCIGMKVLISQRMTPTTIRVRTTVRRGMGQGSPKRGAPVWGQTRLEALRRQSKEVLGPDDHGLVGIFFLHGFKLQGIDGLALEEDRAPRCVKTAAGERLRKVERPCGSHLVRKQ